MNRLARFGSSILPIAVFAGGVCVPGQDPGGDGRPAPPSNSAIKVEQRRILQIKKRPSKRYAARIEQWARELLAMGQDAEGNEPTQRYVMLQLARDGAESVGQPGLAHAAIKELGKWRVDTSQLEYECAVRFTEGNRKYVPDELVQLYLSAAERQMGRNVRRVRRALAGAEVVVSYGRGRISAAVDARLVELQAEAVAAEIEYFATAKRAPIPEGADRVQAQKEVDAAVAGWDRLPHQRRRRFAFSLLRRGQEFGKSPAARHAWLQAAIDCAVKTPDTVLAEQAVHALALQFDVNLLDQLMAVALRIEKGKQFGTVAMLEMFLFVAERALPERVDLAMRALDRATSLCTKQRVAKNYEWYDAECRRLRNQAEFVEQSSVLRVRLAADPKDRDAAFELGWLYLVKVGEWQQGLEYFVASGKFPFNETAKMDLAGPTEAKAIMKVARAWAKATDFRLRSKAEQRVAIDRARYWFEKAKPLVKGLDADQVAQYLKRHPAKKQVKIERPSSARPAIPANARRSGGKAKAGTGDRASDGGDGKAIGEAGYPAALEWLVAHQDESGRWHDREFMAHDPAADKCDGGGNGKHAIGVTALTVLALLDSGSTPKAGPYAAEIKRGLEWLMTQQEANGLLGANTGLDYIYGHAIATLAFVRAQRAAPSEEYAEVAQLGLDYLQQHRNPYAAWRYKPQDNDNDLSVTGWCLTACIEGRDAGFTVQPEVFEFVGKWIEEVTDASGMHGYSKRGEVSSRKPGRHGKQFPVQYGHGLTAAGVWCRLLLGQKRSDPIIRAAEGLLGQRQPEWHPNKIDFYYWYYASSALQRMNGRVWRDWKRALRKAVAKTQRLNGSARGSWDPVGVWGHEGGRVYSTALGALILGRLAR
ncbi:MAG: hypothetical protein NXI31_02360 [bacterium]|nr:hypothetical protein [bacterium]